MKWNRKILGTNYEEYNITKNQLPIYSLTSLKSL